MGMSPEELRSAIADAMDRRDRFLENAEEHIKCVQETITKILNMDEPVTEDDYWQFENRIEQVEFQLFGDGIDD